MSSYLIYHIEFKMGDEWKLVSILRPKEKLKYVSERRFVEIGDKEYNLVYEGSRQGIIRDIFNPHEWYEASFTQRGFPDDMSEELKNFLEVEKMIEWEEQKKNIDPDFEYDKNFNKVPRTKPLSIEEDYIDYRYYKTYATLEEIYSFYKKELIKAKEALKKQLEKDSFTRLNERIDRLEKLIETGKKPNKPSKKKSDDDYDPIPELEENVESIEFIGSWISGINDIVDFYTDSWYDMNEIRVICYIM